MKVARKSFLANNTLGTGRLSLNCFELSRNSGWTNRSSSGLFELSISLAEHQRKLFHPLSDECVPLQTSPSMPTCISPRAALGRKLRAFGEKKMKNYRCRSQATTKINYFRKDRFRSINSPSHFCRLAVCACSSNIHRNKNNSELSGFVVGRLGQGKREAEYKKFSYYSWITSFVATTVCLLLMPPTYKNT